jgi:hypothetical protein
MMMLSLPGSPRNPQLSSPKSLQTDFSSHEMSGRPSSSSEERSTTGIPSEVLLCSRIDEGGLRKDTSGGDTSGGRDLDGDGGGVEASLDEDEESLTGERQRLVPLLSSIVNK